MASFNFPPFSWKIKSFLVILWCVQTASLAFCFFFPFTVKLLKQVVSSNSCSSFSISAFNVIVKFDLQICIQSESPQLQRHSTTWVSHFTYLESCSYFSPPSQYSWLLILVNILPKFETSINFETFIHFSPKLCPSTKAINSFYEMSLLYVVPFQFFTIIILNVVLSTSHLDHPQPLLTGLLCCRLFCIFQFQHATCTIILQHHSCYVNFPAQVGRTLL